MSADDIFVDSWIQLDNEEKKFHITHFLFSICLCGNDLNN